jgi:hypothetical protein
VAANGAAVQGAAATDAAAEGAVTEGAVEDVLILWDCENVRVPSQLAPRVVLRHLHRTFVTGPRRRCVGCYAGFSALSGARLHALDDYVNNNAGLNARMLYAPGGRRKSSSTDHPLVDEMLTFAETCCLARRRGVIVLITGDGDFVRPAAWCTHHGTVRLESVFHARSASQDVMQLDVQRRVEWEALLDAAAPRPAGGWTFEHSAEFVDARAGRQAAHHGRQAADAAAAAERRLADIRARADVAGLLRASETASGPRAARTAARLAAQAARARAAADVKLAALAVQAVQAAGIEAACGQARVAAPTCPDLIDLEEPAAALIALPPSSPRVPAGQDVVDPFALVDQFALVAPDPWRPMRGIETIVRRIGLAALPRAFVRVSEAVHALCTLHLIRRIAGTCKA